MKNDGYSLPELVVVIAIVGSLLSIASLSGKAWLDRYRVESQTKQMYTDLMNARSSAMQKNRMYFVSLLAMQYSIYEDRDPNTTNPNPAQVDGDDIFEPASDKLVQQTNTQYPIVSALIGTPPLSFDRNGLVSMNGTLHIDLTNVSTDPAYDCITLSATRILMGKWSGTNCANQ